MKQEKSEKSSEKELPKILKKNWIILLEPKIREFIEKELKTDEERINWLCELDDLTSKMFKILKPKKQKNER